jgi:thiosulfate/3-mercaptopyruvate sulfurtransferase
MQPLIEYQQLQPGYQVIEIRWYLDGRDGYPAYLRGHIPGAIYLDFDRVACRIGDPQLGRHPFPSPQDFANDLAKLGIKPDRPVVVVDDQQGSIAARVWFMLDALGFESAVLDGGIDAVPASKLCSEPCQLEPVASWRSSIATWPVLLSLPDRVTLLDARARDRYLGIVEPIDPAKGHIPGAISAPWTLTIANGKMRPEDELAKLFRPFASQPTAAYCGSGVTACQLILAARIAGVHIDLYAPSYSGWLASNNEPCIKDCGSLDH